ncbi:MAG: SUMF1/EgtB/PvdO family nonheme iron enzyme, partial [Firmicutes bacterium]|nr:SUMF1/EgtB/PvdO family nonheme iron enzyme [Bacillota bacterium]
LIKKAAEKMADKYINAALELSKRADNLVNDKKTKTEATECVKSDVQHGINSDVVVIYDKNGIPSIMRRFRRITNKELFGGSDKPHPAFIIGGEVYDEIYISVYENTVINSVPHSLPMMKPATDLTLDKAEELCFKKGEGWHLMTAAEWGLIANLSLKNKTLPHGNTERGFYHADKSEHGIKDDSADCITLTGSGPKTWTHDHTIYGVHDLCGNVWEMIRGLRIYNGVFEIAKDNDAALNIDLSKDGTRWTCICDDDGKYVSVSVEDTEIEIRSGSLGSTDYAGAAWGEVIMNCKSEMLKEYALYKGESEALLYVDSTNGEYLPFRGGGWNDGAYAGLFCSNFDRPRSYSTRYGGFRSAFYRKTDNC